MLDSSAFGRIAQVLRGLDRAPLRTRPSKAIEREFARWAGVSLPTFAAATAREGSLQAAAHALALRGAGVLNSKVLRVACVEDRPRALEILWGFARTPFGDAVIATSGHGIVHLEFCDAIAAGQRALTARVQPWRPRLLQRNDAHAVRWARAIFEPSGSRAAQALNLHLVGSAFRAAIWQALLAIDASETLTYGELARAANRPAAARAVGSAVGANRIGWLVPCHHVLRGDGALGGFHWGVDRKRAMLVWESLPPAP